MICYNPFKVQVNKKGNIQAPYDWYLFRFVKSDQGGPFQRTNNVEKTSNSRGQHCFDKCSPLPYSRHIRSMYMRDISKYQFLFSLRYNHIWFNVQFLYIIFSWFSHAIQLHDILQLYIILTSASSYNIIDMINTNLFGDCVYQLYSFFSLVLYIKVNSANVDDLIYLNNSKRMIISEMQESKQDNRILSMT